MVKTVTLYKELILHFLRDFFFIKSLKSKKKMLTLTHFIMSVEKCDCAIQKKLICIDQSRSSIFSYRREFKNV